MNRIKLHSSIRFPLLLFILIALLCSARGAHAAGDEAQLQGRCVVPGTWLRIADKKVVSNGDILHYMSTQRVVLLGEHHDNPDHHRWQLQVIAGLYALRQNLVIGFEMFPQEVQPVLDKWIAGKLSEAEFLSQSNWYGNWSFDPALYMPLLHFARLNRIPLIALNVNRSLSNEVQAQGWAAIPQEQRQGITNPAPPERAYLEMLASSFVQHHPGLKGHEAKTLEQFSAEEKQVFKRFVEGQQLWDRAMAQGLADMAARDNAPLVVGIMGSGHMMDGFGVPHQLSALGIKETASFVPWDEQMSCEDLVPEFAYAVFGLKTFSAPVEDKPQLGVYLEPEEKGVKVVKLVEHSVASSSGIAIGDRIVELAGSAVNNMSEVVAVVQRMVPGTWLPITVLRGNKRLELIAKFPVRQR
jgi:uncharacterized iron-regulated protein